MTGGTTGGIPQVMTFSGDEVIGILNNEVSARMVCKFGPSPNSSTISFEVPGTHAPLGQGIIRFVDDTTFTMRMNSVISKGRRLTHLPVTAEALEKIKNDPETAPILKSVEMIAEYEKTVPWTKPEDLVFDADGQLPDLPPVYEDGFHALIADGYVRFFKSATPSKDLRAWFTRDGGDVSKSQ